MKTVELFFKAYLFLWISFCLSGCVILDHLLGKEPGGVSKEIDANGDGELSKEEIKASKYDINKDGILSVEEMEKALAPHASTSMILGVLSAFNVPFAGAAAMGLNAARENKKHLHSVVGGIDDLMDKKKDGFTKEELYGSIEVFSKKRNNFQALGKMVGKLKKDIRALKKEGKI